MSDRPKFPYVKAMAVAERIATRLRPECARLEIVGSLRRGKAAVSDCEILYVPRIEEIQDPDSLIPAAIQVNMADEEIARMELFQLLGRRKNVNGSETFGPKNKLMVDTASGLGVDLFSTTEENWWVSLVVRTGSLETNLRLTNGAIARGGSLEAYGSGVRWRGGHLSVARSEADVFTFCGVPFLEPKDR